MNNIFNDIPEEHFQARKFLLLASIETVAQSNVDFILTEYPHLDLLRECERFNRRDLIDCPLGDLVSHSKVSFFPWSEASNELDTALALILHGKYKNAYDSIRRALELVVTGTFFTSDKGEYKKAREWIKSERGTPNFKRVIEQLNSLPIFHELNNEYNWGSNLLDIYWQLSDIVHTRGVDSSLHKISPSFNVINSIRIPSFYKPSALNCLNTYISTTQYIASIVAAINPKLLLGLNLDIKFGFNTPISGFFHIEQSERLLDIIDDKYKSFFQHLLADNQEIKEIQRWYDSLPDITEEELSIQATEFEELFKEN